MCGEKFSSCARVTILTGSPPRVRGEAEGTKVIYIGDRITPACAGRRHVVQWSSPSVRDHPPRVRGEAGFFCIRDPSVWITPACAGRSASGSRTGCFGWDHPRVCGEKLHSWFCLLQICGSPPRVRGEGCATRKPCALWRITPACAGRSSRSRSRPTPRRDHPRVCGEKCSKSSRRCRIIGSPPRVRGEENKKCYTDGQHRITPACAGRSGLQRNKTVKSGDHPRVCGEKQSSNPDMYPAHGSPPRVRGEAVYPRSCSRTGRITPACAGRSRKRAARGLAGPDHPRVRGEKFYTTMGAKAIHGSPPRARGEGRMFDRCLPS